MEYTVNFGRLDAAARALPGPAFRIAVLGDASGRGNAGIVETGAALARRKPQRLDVDTLDTVLSRIAPRIHAGTAESGEAMRVEIGEMDDFHPDQLVERVPALQSLMALRKRLSSRAGFAAAAAEVLSWAGAEPLAPEPRHRARGTAVATDRRLDDFTRLVGATRPAATPADALIRRLVGPHVVAGQQGQTELLARVDAVLAQTLRAVLHHPDFQAMEALWRGLDMLVRRVTTGATMEIVLLDISAEELAADLAAADDLGESGLYSVLIEQPALDANQGPYALILGLYEFEATPPHAELLGRVAQLAALAGAPFVAGIGAPALLTPRHTWHPLIQQAWTALQALPAAAYLGLATPRFLLRLPYGEDTDEIEAFEFTEFTRQSGLSGLLWGHPALLVGQLIAATWARGGDRMTLGTQSVVGELPVFVYHDDDDEQLALPCTERLLSERLAATVSSAGVMPVVSLRGRPEIRLAGFASVAGAPLAGRWAPVAMPPPAAASPRPAPAAAPAPQPTPAAAPAAAAPAAAPTAPPEADAGTEELDALLASLSAPPPTPEPTPIPEPAPTSEPAAAPAAAESPTADAETDELDALLASLSQPAPAVAADETEADLDALLASLK